MSRAGSSSAFAGGSAAAGSVASFNGRTGAVDPESGDYAVDDITGLQTALDGKLGASATAADSAKVGGTTPSTFGKSLIDDADAATARGTLGLSTVAASGAYSDLSGKPTLGSAAAASTSDFDAAGAASAVQSASLQKSSNLSDLSNVGTARTNLGAGSPSGLATLDSGGKVPTTQLPSVAITDTFVVNSQSAMLALTAERGDVAIRTDISTSFILSSDSPSTLADWKELLTPADGVTSFNGRTGAVSPAPGDYTASDVGALAAASNLSDLPNPATARDNLGLGDSAPLDVGDTTGTVAAGDDGRFPTADEKDALAGTDGTPSAANPFVTDSDPRLSGSFALTMTVASYGGF